MNFHFLFFLVITICCTNACTIENEEPNSQETSSDEIEYRDIDLDTITGSYHVFTELDTFLISSKLYCLNDSAVSNPIYYRRQDKTITATSISHNYEVEITIRPNSGETITSYVRKEMFAECMNVKHLDRMSIYRFSPKFEFQPNAAVFEIGIGVPDTDDACFVTFDVSLSPNQVGIIKCVASEPLTYEEY